MAETMASRREFSVLCSIFLLQQKFTRPYNLWTRVRYIIRGLKPRLPINMGDFIMPIFCTRLLCHGDNQIHTAPLRRRKTRPHGLNLGTYNIRYSRGFGLHHAIRVVQLVNYDVMILTETKIPYEVYCKNRIGYDVVCSWATPTDVFYKIM